VLRRRAKEVASKDHMEDVKRSILGMSEFMQVVGGVRLSQAYAWRFTAVRPQG
jgi:hypothetical protein